MSIRSGFIRTLGAAVFATGLTSALRGGEEHQLCQAPGPSIPRIAPNSAHGRTTKLIIAVAGDRITFHHSLGAGSREFPDAMTIHNSWTDIVRMEIWPDNQPAVGRMPLLPQPGPSTLPSAR